MDTTLCPGCRAQRAVEQPPCADGHLECPDWACVDCGTALVTGWFEGDVPAVVRAPSHAA
jgi:hypothetical protein